MNIKINKKISLIVCLLILILAIIFVPLLVNASKEYKQIPKLNDEAIAEANQKERERELAYKENFAEEHKNNSNINTLNENKVNSYSYKSDEVMEEAKKQAENKSDKQNNIIKQYYPEEYEKISNEINDYYNNTFVIDLKNSPLLESEKELYDLVLKILENENLSDENNALLKDYINGQMFNISKDEGLKSRADKVLK